MHAKPRRNPPVVHVGLLEFSVHPRLHLGHLASEIRIALVQSDVKTYERDGATPGDGKTRERERQKERFCQKIKW